MGKNAIPVAKITTAVATIAQLGMLRFTGKRERGIMRWSALNYAVFLAVRQPVHERQFNADGFSNIFINIAMIVWWPHRSSSTGSSWRWYLAKEPSGPSQADMRFSALSRTLHLVLGMRVTTCSFRYCARSRCHCSACCRSNRPSPVQFSLDADRTSRAASIHRATQRAAEVTAVTPPNSERQRPRHRLAATASVARS